MSKVRLHTVSVPRFLHADLEFGKSWNEYDVAGMTEKQREAVRTYLGSHIQVHPHDKDKLEALLAEPQPGETSKRRTESAGDTESGADKPLDEMTVAELRRFADDLGVEIPTDVRKKADIIALLEEATK